MSSIDPVNSGDLKVLASLKSPREELKVLTNWQQKQIAGIPQEQVEVFPPLEPDDPTEAEFLSGHKLWDAGSSWIAQPPDVIPKQLDLDLFVSYVFDRRFGWSETEVGAGSGVGRSEAGITDAAIKTKLNENLDKVLLW